MQIAYRIAGALAGLTLLATSCWYIGHLRAELHSAQEATRTAQVALKKTQATLAYREKLRAATALEVASSHASLRAATALNPTWANTQVPQEVQIALCAHIDCLAAPGGLRDSTTNGSP